MNQVHDPTMMEKLRLGAERLGLRLSPWQLQQFQDYYQELLDWNQRMNLTAITGYDEVQVKHFLDSLTVTLALTLPEAEGFRLIDVGTGAGLPGIPLKILLPRIGVVLLDSTAKKAEFLRHLKSRLQLPDIEVAVGRAEDAAHDAKYRERFDLVLSRAVGTLPTTVELALPFCAIGGSFIAQKKGAVDAELKAAARAISLLGGQLRETRTIDLPEFTDQRRLVIIDKVSSTPDKYPRRPGVPTKRPLL